jgi:micrococcal nuclease
MFKLFLSLCLALNFKAQATSIEGTVVYVYDGDTLLLSPTESMPPIKVRLADIDAPEISQDYGQYARSALMNKVLKQKIQVQKLKHDIYQRLIGRLSRQSRCIECEMVLEGHAWVAPKLWDRTALYQLEASARQANRGLWRQKITLQIPPWVWRKQHRTKR